MKDADDRERIEHDLRALLERALEQLPLEVPDGQRQRLVGLVLLLEAWSGKINLTGHRDALAMAQGLVLDAAALAATLPELDNAKRVADLGTGAGFPGLPLAILFPETEFHLVDSRKKRNHFQREARRRLDLSNVRPILGRSDEVQQIACEVVIAQAMTQPAEALELMAQWAGPTGILALPGSEASSPPDTPAGFGVAELREYFVPESGTRRRLWLTRRDR